MGHVRPHAVSSEWFVAGEYCPFTHASSGDESNPCENPDCEDVSSSECKALMDSYCSSHHEDPGCVSIYQSSDDGGSTGAVATCCHM